MAETNCCENSEQISRLLETFLILVKHGSGSKITRPADVCRVRLVCLGVCWRLALGCSTVLCTHLRCAKAWWSPYGGWGQSMDCYKCLVLSSIITGALWSITDGQSCHFLSEDSLGRSFCFAPSWKCFLARDPHQRHHRKSNLLHQMLFVWLIMCLALSIPAEKHRWSMAKVLPPRDWSC